MCAFRLLRARVIGRPSLSGSITRRISTKSSKVSLRQSRTISQSFFFAPASRRPHNAVFSRIFRRAFASARGPVFPKQYQSALQVKRAIIGLNAIVFGFWAYANYAKDRKLLNELSKHFTISLRNFREGRYDSLLLSAFSHQNLAHFAFNMITFDAFCGILIFAGVPALQIVGLCATTAIVGSAGFLYEQQQRPGGSSTGLGASGMVMGVGAAATCLIPRFPMQILFIPVSLPLWSLTLLYAGVDTYSLHSNSPIGHSAHLGGSIAGLLFYFGFLRRFGGIASTMVRTR